MRERSAARREDARYPGDETWRLSVTFRPDGTFVWKSERKDAGPEPVDESLAGTYSVEGRTVTYRFEEPSPAARRALPGLFAWWPAPRVGKQRYRFEGDVLVLAFEGGKVWIHLRRGEP